MRETKTAEAAELEVSLGMTPVGGALVAYEPRNLQEAKDMATMFAESKAIKDVTSQARAFYIMAIGADMGIGATAALRAIKMVGDTPCIEAKLKLALCRRAKHLCRHFKMISSDDTRAVFETWRTDEDVPITIEFTIENAYTMLGKSRVDDPDGNWFKIRRRMLRWRAIGELADLAYPELMLGLGTEEEHREIIDMKPIVMDPAQLAGAAAAVSAGAAAEKAQRTAERAAAAAQDPGDQLTPQFEAWANVLGNATTLQQCDEVANHMKETLAKDSPARARGQAMVKAAKERIKAVAQGKPAPAGAPASVAPSPATAPPAGAPGQQTLPTNPIDRTAQPQLERVPGEDDN